MEASVFERCLSQIEERFSQLPDKRVGSNRFIKMKDIGLSAFSVFFTQALSFLEHQRALKAREGYDNADSLFNVDHIPSDLIPSIGSNNTDAIPVTGAPNH